MAAQLVAGHAFSNLDAGSMFAARDVAGFSPAVAPMVARQESGPTSVNIFIDGQPEFEYAASVVAACADHTVYAVQCTGGGPSSLCGSDSPPATITENASQYHVSSAVTTKTLGVEVKVTLIEECELAGTTAATCTATVAGSAEGQKTTTSATTTYDAASALHFDVAITAGNQKLVNPTGTCSGASTRAVALWGLLGAVGAVGVLAL
ncbi:hypothetical protein SAMD00023353_2301470 [Rosellinia necatrix]|uniref:Uncharacterized protein n=1 Tax=Rosellinia necatrix TaxID=77044 RepID=A0A1W2TGB6_ROSNE|nr:hypothetical protein SAMD00023353_2301470 [Rosellinia necatrix]